MFRSSVFSTLSLLLLLAVGCAAPGGDPMGPGGDSGSSGPSVARGTVGASGGTLVAEDGSFSMTVPSGALAADTQIVLREIEVPEVPFGTALRGFVLEAEGVEFAQAVTIEATYDARSLARRIGDYPDIDIVVPVVVVGSSDNQPNPTIDFTDVAGITLSLDHGRPENSSVRIEVRGLDAAELLLVRPSPQGSGIDPLASVVQWEVRLEETNAHARWEYETTIRYPLGFLPAESPSLGRFIDANRASELVGFPNPDQFMAPNSEQMLSDGRFEQDFRFRLSYQADVAEASTTEFDLAYGVSFDYDLGRVLEGYEGEMVRIDVEHSFPEQTLALDPRDEEDDEDWDTGSFRIATRLEGGFVVQGFYDHALEGTMVMGSGEGTKIVDPSGAPQNYGQGVWSIGYGAIVVGARPILRAPGDPQILSTTLIEFGPGLLGFKVWSDEIGGFGMTQIVPGIGNVTDAVPYSNEGTSGGFTYVSETQSRVGFLEYDGEYGFSTIGNASNFPDATGPAFSAFRRTGRDALVITNAMPGQLYRTEIVDYVTTSTLVGTLGDDPRRVRALGDFAVVSNFGSDSLSPVLWGDDGDITILDEVPVGDGPVGIDLRMLSNGNIAVCSTGFNDDTWSVTVFTPQGGLVSNTKRSLPSGTAPGHAMWLPSDEGLVAVSGNESGTLEIMVSGVN